MYLRSVLDCIAEGDYTTAILKCKNAIKKTPGFYIYYEHLADIYFRVSDFDNCKHVIEEGLVVNSQSVFLNHLKNKLSEQPALFCGKYDFYPNNNSERFCEGGKRLNKKNITETEQKQNKPLVSIVTAVYNNTETLERCIKSVLNQTYDNVEHIIVDGGSDKPTIDILFKYTDEIEYFISEADKGIYNAMNKGIEVSKGDYVCLLNSDDFYSPDFIEKSISVLEGREEISYCDYYANNNEILHAEKINEGVFLGHLNICHNTFLVPKSVYNKVGRYDENYRIVSDAVWIRKAYQLGIKFKRIEECLFTLSDGGLSSGASEKDRRLFIDEVVSSYVKEFPFLSSAEAEELYLFRFNNKRITKLLDIGRKYKDQFGFIKSLGCYVEYCFRNRNNFKLSHVESDNLFLKYIEAIELLDIRLESIRINTKHGCFSDLLVNYSSIINNRKKHSNKTILHFVSVFSAPSETFIYDLLNRLQGCAGYDNFVLFEHRKLSEERPYINQLYIPWNDFRPEIRDQLYKYVFSLLSLDLVIAHFALNEWKLHKRIQPLGLNYPTLTMTHGIDVFNLKVDEEYKNYVVGNFSKRLDTKFTTVSDYLFQELTKQGVPEAKITKIHNVANQRFLENRKCTGFFDYKRTLKVLSVGRCIDWKGHIDLLYGLRKFIDKTYNDTELTIVYGNGIDNLRQIQSVIDDLSLNDFVQLIPFVNFSEEKDYFSKFDIYIQASKYTNDELRKSETFGVATLEAILSGLPVIVTNAGGLPEVVGENSQFSKIVQHTSSNAIAEALDSFFRDPNTFSDNIEYARDRLNRFSEEKQITSLVKEIELLTTPKIKVAMFSTSTIQGAGYAAFRLFRGLRDHSAIEPTLFTTVRNHENEVGVKVIKHPSGDGKAWQVKQDPSNSKPGLTIFTINDHAISNSQLWEWVKDFDVINIHWTARFLSVENIAYLSNLDKPLVMTIRDMLPLTGGCHYFHGCEKWKSDCSDCPQLIDNYDNFPQKVLQTKRQEYNFKNITLVALSQHTKSIIEQTPAFNECRVEVIPNSIETDVFRPYDKVEARKKLGLPLDRKIIGYVPSFSSEVKGYKEAIEVFDSLKNSCTDAPLVMLVGNKTPADDAISLDKISLGYIADNQRLAIAYSAADVVIVPSLEETFSNTTAESISCGTPVVGFKTGAIPDLAINGVTGHSYDVGDINAFVEGVRYFLNSNQNVKFCRDFSLSKLSFNLQANCYNSLFDKLMK